MKRYSSNVSYLSQPPCLQGKWALYGGECVDGDAAWDLFCAAADGHVDTIMSLLAQDPRLVHAQYWYSIPLRFAVLGGHAEAVKVLLDAGSQPGMLEAYLFDWETFLENAETRGDDDVYKLLVAEMKARYGFEPNRADYLALCQEIESLATAKVKKRLKAQPELVRLADVRGNTALHHAALAGAVELVDICLDHGAHLEAGNYEAATPFDLGDETIKRHLLKRGAAYDFYAACSLGDEATVRGFLSDDDSLARRLYRSHNSPLTIASKGGFLKLVQILLDHGADPNLKEQQFDRGGALFMASACGNLEIVQLLLEHGADPNGPCESSGASIDHAATEEIAALLLKHGSSGRWQEASGKAEDIRKAIAKGELGECENGFDPLIAQVIWSGQPELLALYVEKFGTEPIAQLFPGSGPGGWFVPKDGVSEAFLDALIGAGFDVNRPSWVGRTHLHFVASRNKCDIARKLIARGANVNAVSLETGTTPLGSAARQGHRAMVQLLLKHGADPSLPHDRPKLQPRALAERYGHGELLLGGD